MDLQALQKHIEAKIPLSVHTGFQIINMTENHSELFFPLQPNRNHKMTAFGGSLYVAGTLAAYSLFFHHLLSAGYSTNEIVISKGEMDYKAPVDKDFTTKAFWTDKGRSEFFKTLKSKNKARVEIEAQVLCDHAPCALFRGLFVAMK